MLSVLYELNFNTLAVLTFFDTCNPNSNISLKKINASCYITHLFECPFQVFMNVNWFLYTWTCLIIIQISPIYCGIVRTCGKHFAQINSANMVLTCSHRVCCLNMPVVFKLLWTVSYNMKTLRFRLSWYLQPFLTLKKKNNGGKNYQPENSTYEGWPAKAQGKFLPGSILLPRISCTCLKIFARWIAGLF